MPATPADVETCRINQAALLRQFGLDRPDELDDAELNTRRIEMRNAIVRPFADKEANK